MMPVFRLKLIKKKSSYYFDQVGKILFILCINKANVRFFQYCRRFFCFFIARNAGLYFLDSPKSLLLQKLGSLLRSVSLLFYVLGKGQYTCCEF
jgi:hypothetical protein